MILFRKPFYILIIVLLFSCSGKEQLKEKPQGLWEKCPNCHGYGKIESISSRESNDDVTRERNPGDDVEFCSSMGGCFFGLFEFNSAPSSDDLYAKHSRDKYDYADPDSNYDTMRNQVPEQSYRVKKVRCPRCEGKGWVKPYPPLLDSDFSKKKW